VPGFGLAAFQTSSSITEMMEKIKALYKNIVLLCLNCKNIIFFTDTSQIVPFLQLDHSVLQVQSSCKIGAHCGKRMRGPGCPTRQTPRPPYANAHKFQLDYAAGKHADLKSSHLFWSLTVHWR
jgi:hypothetical protein